MNAQESSTKVYPEDHDTEEDVGCWWGKVTCREVALRRLMLPFHLIIYPFAVVVSIVLLPYVHSAGTVRARCFYNVAVPNWLRVVLLYMLSLVIAPVELVLIIIRAFLPIKWWYRLSPQGFGIPYSPIMLLSWAPKFPLLGFISSSPRAAWWLIMLVPVELTADPSQGFQENMRMGTPGSRELWRWSVVGGSSLENERVATLLHSAAKLSVAVVRTHLRHACGADTSQKFRHIVLNPDERKDSHFSFALEMELCQMAAAPGIDFETKIFPILCRFRKSIRVDSPDPDGRTLLHRAACRGKKNWIEHLVNIYGAVVDTSDRYGWTSLHYAAEGDYPECVECLLGFGARQLAALDGRYPLEVAGARSKNLLSNCMQKWEATQKLLCSGTQAEQKALVLYKILPENIPTRCNSQIASAGAKAWLPRAQLNLGEKLYADDRARLLVDQLVVPLMGKLGEERLSFENKNVLRHCLRNLAGTGLTKTLSLAPIAQNSMDMLADKLRQMYSELKVLPNSTPTKDQLFGRAVTDPSMLLQTTHMPTLAWLDKDNGLAIKDEGKMALSLLEAGAFKTSRDFSVWVSGLRSKVQETSKVDPLSSKRGLRLLCQAVAEEAMARYFIGWGCKINASLKPLITDLFGKGGVRFAPVKGIDRVLDKLSDDKFVYGYHAAANIRDYVRFSVMCSDEDDLLMERAKLIDPPPWWFEPLKEKNGFHSSVDDKATNGYRDVKILGVLSTGLEDTQRRPIKQVIEVQLLIHGFLEVKKSQHLLYEVLRGDFN